MNNAKQKYVILPNKVISSLWVLRMVMATKAKIRMEKDREILMVEFELAAAVLSYPQEGVLRR